MFFLELITEANDDVVGFGEAGQAAVAVTGGLHIVYLRTVMVADMNHDVVIPPLSAQPSFRLLVGYLVIVGVGWVPSSSGSYSKPITSFLKGLLLLLSLAFSQPRPVPPAGSGWRSGCQGGASYLIAMILQSRHLLEFGQGDALAGCSSRHHAMTGHACPIG
ncbi:hypothetical protein ACOAMY_16590 [Pseudomonas aeruginosa]